MGCVLGPEAENLSERSQESSNSADFSGRVQLYRAFEVYPCLNFHPSRVGDSIVRKGNESQADSPHFSLSLKK